MISKELQNYVVNKHVNSDSPRTLNYWKPDKACRTQSDSLQDPVWRGSWRGCVSPSLHEVLFVGWVRTRLGGPQSLLHLLRPWSSPHLWNPPAPCDWSCIPLWFNVLGCSMKRSHATKTCVSGLLNSKLIYFWYEGSELTASHSPGRHSAAEPYPQPPFKYLP